jgi:hypothetical protein
VSAYVNDAGYRVEAIAPNRGAAEDRPQRLPSLGTHAMPLRFLDFLIRETTTAGVLHDGGILINVPPPERYALHKLIVARLRPAGNPKTDKDLRQAEVLLDVLAERRAPDLREAWKEATARGPKWRQHLLAGLEQLSPALRERVRDALRPSEEP